MHWIHSIHDRVQWPALVNILRNTRGPSNMENYLTSCVTVSFLIRTAPMTAGLVLVRMYLQSYTRRVLCEKVNLCASRPQGNSRKRLSALSPITTKCKWYCTLKTKTIHINAWPNAKEVYGYHFSIPDRRQEIYSSSMLNDDKDVNNTR